MESTIALKGLSSVALVIIVTFTGVAAPNDAPDDSAQVPDHVLEQMVRISLENALRDAVDGTVVYVVEQHLKASWVPQLANAEIRLLTWDETHEREATGEKYYYFLRPEPVGDGYRISLVYGTSCAAEGRLYVFRSDADGVTLRTWETPVFGEC